MTAVQDDEILTYDEAAVLLKLPKGSLYALVATGNVPYYRLSARTVRFSRNALLSWLEARQSGTGMSGGGQ